MRPRVSPAHRSAQLDSLLNARSSVRPASSVTWGVGMGQSASPLANFRVSRQIGLFLLWVSVELSTIRQMMKVLNEPGLSPNNSLENVFLSEQSMASNPRKGQAKCLGARTTIHDGKAGHVMTQVCHLGRQRTSKCDRVNAHAGNMHLDNWHLGRLGRLNF